MKIWNSEDEVVGTHANVEAADIQEEHVDQLVQEIKEGEVHLEAVKVWAHLGGHVN